MAYYSYIWNEDESDDSRCPQSQTQCKQRCVGIQVFRQHKTGHGRHYQYHTCDVNDDCNIFTIVDTFHFHLACGEGQDDSNKLQKSFVANQDTQENGMCSICATYVNIVVLGNSRFLGHVDVAWVNEILRNHSSQQMYWVT